MQRYVLYVMSQVSLYELFRTKFSIEALEPCPLSLDRICKRNDLLHAACQMQIVAQHNTNPNPLESAINEG